MTLTVKDEVVHPSKCKLYFKRFYGQVFGPIIPQSYLNLIEENDHPIFYINLLT